MSIPVNQLVLITTDRKCPDCGKVVWQWIKNQEEIVNGRCSCGSLYKQIPIKNYIEEEWIEEDVDITPYI